MQIVEWSSLREDEVRKPIFSFYYAQMDLQTWVAKQKFPAHQIDSLIWRARGERGHYHYFEIRLNETEIKAWEVAI